MTERAGFTNSALIHLLARLREAENAKSPAHIGAPSATTVGQAHPRGFTERLSAWFGWADAISLSTVLNAPTSEIRWSGAAAEAADADRSACMSVRQSLTRSIREDSVLSAAPGRAPRQLLPGESPAPPATDFAPYRQRYLTRQQAMEAGVDALRERLRARLAMRSSEAAHLAAVDAAMARVLDGRERALLATVPTALESHFKRLREAAQATDTPDAIPVATPPPPAHAWLDVFCRDMQTLLLAELDFRFQPVDGLLEALRDPTPQASRPGSTAHV